MAIAEVCPGIKEPMPLPKLLQELIDGDYSAEGIMQHLLVHLAKSHMEIATLRSLVHSAYEEGADDGAMDRDNFLRSNAKSALDDLE